MSVTMMIVVIGIGLIIGMISGLVGIGGGLLVIPVLVFIFNFSQPLAQGTTLALMVPPIGFFAAYEYYKHGNVDIRMAALICIGFVVGGYFGAKLVPYIPEHILRKAFALLLAYSAFRLFLKK